MKLVIIEDVGAHDYNHDRGVSVAWYRVGKRVDISKNATIDELRQQLGCILGYSRFELLTGCRGKKYTTGVNKENQEMIGFGDDHFGKAPPVFIDGWRTLKELGVQSGDIISLHRKNLTAAFEDAITVPIFTPKLEVSTRVERVRDNCKVAAFKDMLKALYPSNTFNIKVEGKEVDDDALIRESLYKHNAKVETTQELPHIRIRDAKERHGSSAGMHPIKSETPGPNRLALFITTYGIVGGGIGAGIGGVLDATGLATNSVLPIEGVYGIAVGIGIAVGVILGVASYNKLESTNSERGLRS